MVTFLEEGKEEWEQEGVSLGGKPPRTRTLLTLVCTMLETEVGWIVRGMSDTLSSPKVHRSRNALLSYFRLLPPLFLLLSLPPSVSLFPVLVLPNFL